MADAAGDLLVVPAERRAGPDDRPHGGAADEIDRLAGCTERADHPDMRVGARAAAREHQAYGGACQDARHAAQIGRIAFAHMEQPRGRRRIEPSLGPGRMLAAFRLDQHQIHQPVLVNRPTGEGGRLERRLLVAATDQQHPVHLTRRKVGPGVLPPLRHEQHDVVALLHRREPLGGRRHGLYAQHRDGEAERHDVPLDRLHHRPDRRCIGDADQGEYARRARPGARRRLASAGDGQAGHLRHQCGVLARRIEERAPRQGEDFGIPHGQDRRRMRRAGDQRHLAGRLAGLDDAEKMLGLVLFPSDHAKPPGAQQIERVGRIARRIERPPAGQGEPRHVGRSVLAEKQAHDGAVVRLIVEDVAEATGGGGHEAILSAHASRFEGQMPVTASSGAGRERISIAGRPRRRGRWSARPLASAPIAP